ncbi:hypothetical protein Tco_1540176 [Tanacetum coccineum]
MSALKLPMLKTRDYDLYKHENGAISYSPDYVFGGLIENGMPSANNISSAAPIVTKFHVKQGCKTLREANKASIRSNKKNQRKMQKTILKWQYKNFAASRSEGLDKTYDRDGSQMAGGHAYHEGKKILKEDHGVGKELNVTTATRDGPRRNEPMDTSTTNALVVQDGIGGYDCCFQAEEGITNFALMAYTSQGLSSSSSSDFEVHTCSKDCLKSYELDSTI